MCLTFNKSCAPADMQYRISISKHGEMAKLKLANCCAVGGAWGEGEAEALRVELRVLCVVAQTVANL